MHPAAPADFLERARYVQSQLPPGGLFADQEWRISPSPFPLAASFVRELESLGRILLQFYRAVNLLHRQSHATRQPRWIAELLDQGKPEALLQWQSEDAFKRELPRVIRPDILLTEEGFAITELDSVPGGIGLTAWLNKTYSEGGDRVIGGTDGMLQGFEGIFGDAATVNLVISSESASYRPEMEWLAGQLTPGKFQVRDEHFQGFQPGNAVYRFFELFDLANIPAAEAIFEGARSGDLTVTPPPRPIFEEKLLLALLWNRNLREFWRQQLGDGFLKRLLACIPYTWVIDPAPLPPHAAYPELNLTDWQQLKGLSQRERDLILKVSGYSEKAWGARGVYLGSDLSQADWSTAVDEAINAFPRSPYILQRYHKPRTVDAAWVDIEKAELMPMKGRVRLCPYYFVHGEGDAARTQLGGVLATICPADKKIIHGMRDAILAPCSIAAES
ncbi:MAG TPA: hypothetical protein VLD18_09870 [Verrucomicrobiae bacterium]|nr:hypothetical protein [Verrucomicrobiae bacterium]